MYKVGDEVLIKGEVVEVMDAVPYPTKVKLGKGEDAYVFSNDELCYTDKIVKTYSDGLSDAWELAKKIYDMTCTQIEKIFDVDGGFWNVVREITVEEALAKIEAYEKEREIKVGDVIKYDGTFGVVVRVGSCTVNALFEDGITIEMFISECKKTGKHIDIESLLRQIGE